MQGHAEKHETHPAAVKPKTEHHEKKYDNTDMPETQTRVELSTEMPCYNRIAESVHAVKIAAIEYNADGDGTITPEETGYKAFAVDRAFTAAHDPKVGGYYIVHEDGSTSYASEADFEQGHELAHANRKAKAA
jgi:hypothetical protein